MLTRFHVWKYWDDQEYQTGNVLVAQMLGLRAFTAEDLSVQFLVAGTETLQAGCLGQKKTNTQNPPPNQADRWACFTV